MPSAPIPDDESANNWLDTPAPVPNQELPTAHWADAAHRADAPRRVDAPPRSHNPYQVGAKVTRADLFFGREEERRALRTQLQSMGSVEVVGLRRMGKSSLLHFMAHHEPWPASQRPLLIASLDLHDGRCHTRTGLLSEAIRHWAIATGHPSPEVDSLPLFAHLVESLGKGREGTSNLRLVLCLDEFENLFKRPDQFGDDLFESWRALANDGRLAFLIAAQTSIAELMAQHSLTSPFFNIFQTIELGLLTPAAAQDLLTKPLQAAGFTPPPDFAPQMIARYGRHPFFLQMAAQAFTNGLLAGLETAVALAQTEAEMFAQCAKHWQSLWQHLSSDEQTMLATLPANPTPEQAKVNGRLLRKGVIISTAGGYAPFSQQFAQWLRAEHPAPTFSFIKKLLGRK